MQSGIKIRPLGASIILSLAWEFGLCGPPLYLSYYFETKFKEPKRKRKFYTLLLVLWLRINYSLNFFIVSDKVLKVSDWGFLTFIIPISTFISFHYNKTYLKLKHLLKYLQDTVIFLCYAISCKVKLKFFISLYIILRFHQIPYWNEYILFKLWSMYNL